MKVYIKNEYNAITARIRAAISGEGFGAAVLGDLIGVVLLCLFSALLCVGAAEALDLYLGMALSSALLFLAITTAGRLLGGERRFTLSAMLLMAVGMALQVLLFSSDQSSLRQVHSLVLFAAIGLAGGILLILGFRALAKLKRQWFYLLLGGGALLIYLLLLVAGISAGGTKAWMLIGSFSFQPTELTKVLGLLAAALLVTDETLSAEKRLWGLLINLLIHTVFLVAVNELGTLLILAVVSLLLAFIYLPNTKRLVLLVLILLLIAALLVAGCYGCHRFAEARTGETLPAVVELGSRIFQKIEIRMGNLLDPTGADPFNEGYQAYKVRQVLSTAKLIGGCTQQAVPVIDSDFIFIFVVGHFGILAAIGVTVLMILMTFEGTIAVLHRRAGAETAVALAFVLCIAVTSFISALSALCLFPTVGVGFAFLSRGGTASAVNYMMLFFILYGMRRPIKTQSEINFKRGDPI